MFLALAGACGDDDGGSGADAAAVDASSQPDASSAEWMTGWMYRRPILVSNETGGVLADFPVFADFDSASLIGDTKMRADAADLRVTDGDGTTLVAHWIESGLGTPSTRIWVKVPILPEGGRLLYLYYGNSVADSVASGTDTFTLFDDFDGTELDSELWTEVTIDGGDVSVAGGELHLSAVEGDGGGIGNVSAIIGPAVDGPVMVGAGLTRIDAPGALTHADLLLRSTSSGFYWQNGTWALTTYAAEGEVSATQSSNTSGTTAQLLARPAAGELPFILYLARDAGTDLMAGFWNHASLGELSLDITGWDADEVRYLSLSANSYDSVPPFDYRFDWVFAAKLAVPSPEAMVLAEQSE